MRHPPPAARSLPVTLAACLALLACAGNPPPAPATPPDSCSDGVQDGGETGVDCGGPCAACAGAGGCTDGRECASGVCTDGTCAAPSCSDGVQNGDEQGVDCGGATCDPCAIGGGCVSGSDCATGVCLDGTCDCGAADAVYVSATTGDDANPGTAAAPLRTIQAAVACARKVPRDVRVAEGAYDSADASRVTLVDGKSLVGGWSTDFAVRSPADHVSVIRDTTDTGTTGSGDAVLLSSTSTATVLDGFTIQATTLGAGIRATALSVSPPQGGRAGATVRNDVIECGGNPGILFARCIDLGTAGGSVVIADNAIRLGTSDPAGGTSWGVQGYGVSNAEIARNAFSGGASAAIVGVDLWVADGASPVVEANDFRLGDGGDAAVRLQLMATGASPAVRNNVVVVTGDATGIDDGASAELSNNTVVAATGTAIRTSGASRIRNNAIATDSGGTCLAETSATAAPASVGNNDLSGCGAVYVDASSPPPLSLSELNALPGASGNLAADPLLDAANGYRPLPGSPLLGAGLDLSSLFQADKAGAIRTAPWSIGAYQGP